jgi:uncharacterized protein YndB with AHSA1/START domain
MRPILHRGGRRRPGNLVSAPVLWVWVALSTVAMAAAVVALVGAMLPVGHAAARRARFEQPAAAVYEAITDIDAFARWRPGLKSVEWLPDRHGRRCYREVSKFGPMEIAIERAEPGRRLVTCIVTPASPFGGSWTYELEETGNGAATVLTITENGEVYNVVFRALSRFVFGHASTIDGYLRALGKKFGQEVSIGDAQPAPAPGKSPS